MKVNYKVMIPLGKINIAIESENAKKPTQKYVQIMIEDNFEFWFMGLSSQHFKVSPAGNLSSQMRLLTNRVHKYK
ncbi:gem-like protein 6 [Phtheirospermum japonicum]|uniref:Gem-like protein 6 n=1 Tax=Phtheirospermum japonicum TaxID=374723 RepID=A0A830D8N1_9LAMI|nr:gem-like protein 6 [Phtheirospermum japonicum]